MSLFCAYYYCLIHNLFCFLFMYFFIYISFKFICIFLHFSFMSLVLNISGKLFFPLFTLPAIIFFNVYFTCYRPDQSIPGAVVFEAVAPRALLQLFEVKSWFSGVTTAHIDIKLTWNVITNTNMQKWFVQKVVSSPGKYIQGKVHNTDAPATLHILLTFWQFCWS